MMDRMSEQTRKSPNVKAVLIVAAASIVFAFAMAVVGYLSSRPPEGSPIAVFEIHSGEPFERRLVSSGGNLQVWLDVECDDCSYPIDGNMRLTGEGRTIESVEISAGSTRRGGWEGEKRSMSTRNVFEAKVPRAGVAMTLAGVLTVHGGRDYFMHRVKADAPPPRVQLLRLTVTK
jgi:hypothetical protein